MANPQKENGFIPIASEIAEKLARYRIAGQEWQVIWVILRKTWGWHKKSDSISLSQIEKATEMSRREVCRAIDSLEERRVITSDKKVTSRPNIYRFNKDYDKWVDRDNAVTSDKKVTSASDNAVLKVVTKLSPTIDIYTKDKNKDNSDVPSQNTIHQDIVQIIDSFREINPVYKKWYGNTTQRDAIQRLLETHGKEQLLKVLEFLPISNKTPFVPVATTPLQLEDKWAAITDSWAKKKVELLTNVNKYKIAF